MRLRRMRVWVLPSGRHRWVNFQYLLWREGDRGNMSYGMGSGHMISGTARWIVFVLAGVSALLCIGTVAVWVASYSEDWMFIGGGMRAGEGNFRLIYARGRYEYDSAAAHIRFSFWQPALGFSVLSAALWCLGQSRILRIPR